MRGRIGQYLVHRQRVVPAHDRRLPQLVDVAGQVVDEGVVVVDEEDHGAASTSISARALSSVSRYSCSGSESATMPPPAWKYICPPTATIGADDDARIHRAGDAEIADGAAVHPPAGGLQLGDDLHRPHLGRAGDRAAGKGGPEQGNGIGPGRQLSHHRRDEVVNGRVLLQGEQLGDPYRAGAADAGQIVSQQIHDHHVLRPVLVALGQGSSERGVVHRAQAAGTGALDGSGLDVPAVLVQAKEALGGGAQHRHFCEVEVGGKGRRIPAPELPIQIEKGLGGRA